MRTDCGNLKNGWCEHFLCNHGGCADMCAWYWTAPQFAWIKENRPAFEWIAEQYRQEALAGRVISVRDLFAAARSRFAGEVRPDGEGYKFNNNITPELSRLLFDRFRDYGPKVKFREGKTGEVTSSPKAALTPQGGQRLHVATL